MHLLPGLPFSGDHAVRLSIPPKYSVASAIRLLKGKSASEVIWTRKRHGNNRFSINDGNEIEKNSLAIGEGLLERIQQSDAPL